MGTRHLLCWWGGDISRHWYNRKRYNRKRRGWSHSDSPWRRSILGICGWNVFCLLALFFFLWINWTSSRSFALLLDCLSFFMFFIFISSSPHPSHPPPLSIAEVSLDSLWFYLVTFPSADVSALLTRDENNTSGMQACFHLNCFAPRVLYCAIGDVENPHRCTVSQPII